MDVDKLQRERDRIRRALSTVVVHRVCTECGADYLERHEEWCIGYELADRLKVLDTLLVSTSKPGGRTTAQVAVIPEQEDVAEVLEHVDMTDDVFVA